MKCIIYLILLISLLNTVACSTTAKVWKPYDDITIEAKSSINPDGKNRSSPIQIKIYELSARSTFDNLDFDRAFYNAKTFLSDELISDAEYTIQPSETITHTVDLQKSAHFIAILAGFIDIDNARWKHVYQVKPYGHYKHRLTISEKDIIAGKIEEEIEQPTQKKETFKEEKNDSSITAEDLEKGVDKGTESLEKANSTKNSLEGLFGK